MNDRSAKGAEVRKRQDGQAAHAVMVEHQLTCRVCRPGYTCLEAATLHSRWIAARKADVSSAKAAEVRTLSTLGEEQRAALLAIANLSRYAWYDIGNERELFIRINWLARLWGADPDLPMDQAAADLGIDAAMAKFREQPAPATEDRG